MPGKETRGVLVERMDAVRDALRRYREGSADFADYLLLEVAEREHAAPLLTFDRRLAKQSGAALLT